MHTTWSLYQITNTLNGKRYIGITRIGVTKRWQTHINKAAIKAPRSAIANAIRKYGAKNFVVVKLISGMSAKEAALKERLLIRELGTLCPNGYNLGHGGESHIGVTVSDATRERMRVSHLGKRPTKESTEKRRAALKGRPLTKDHAAKIAASSRGKRMSAEARDNIRKAVLEVWRLRKAGLIPPRKKRAPHTDETRKRMREGQIKRQSATNQLANVNRSRKGKPRAASHTAAILAAKAAKRGQLSLGI